MYRLLLIQLRCLLSICFVFLALGFAGAQKTITGTITDSENGDALIGANILIKGTPNGTVTDFNGNYSLQVTEGDVLVISYTGYDTKEMVVGAAMDYDVMLESGEALDEVVVIG